MGKIFKLIIKFYTFAKWSMRFFLAILLKIISDILKIYSIFFWRCFDNTNNLFNIFKKCKFNLNSRWSNAHSIIYQSILSYFHPFLSTVNCKRVKVDKWSKLHPYAPFIQILLLCATANWHVRAYVWVFIYSRYKRKSWTKGKEVG